MKRLYADDSADSRVKVGNRQAPLAKNPRPTRRGFLHWRGGKAMTARWGPWRRRAGELAGQDPHTGCIRIVAISAATTVSLRPRAARKWSDAESLGLI